jgi:3-phytase
MNRILTIVVLALAVGAGVSIAAEPTVVVSTLETEPFFEDDDADADDPAIWVHRGDGSASIVVGTGAPRSETLEASSSRAAGEVEPS